MANIVGIVKDDKLRKEVEKYCQEVGGEDLRFAAFSSTQEFQSIYFKSPEEKAEPTPSEQPSPEQPPSEESSAEGAELNLFSDLDLLVIDEECLSLPASEAALYFLKQTKQFGYWPEEGRTRFLLLKYEEDGIDKIPYLHPAIDELIYLPLDRPLFLQKVEILLNLPKLVKPSYLYSQESKEPVEISKIVSLDKLNDCALAVRNRTALQNGVRGKFYLVPPTGKNIIRFFGKVFKSVPHPEHPGEYLVYFFFFGMRKQEVSVIRQWLNSNSNYHSLRDQDPKSFAFNADNMFLDDDEKKVKTVAVVDFDKNHSENLIDFLERHIGQISLASYESYSLFYEMGLALEGLPQDFTPNPSESAHLPIGSLKIVCDPETKNLKEVLPEATDELQFCGYSMTEIFVEGQNNWWSLFDLRQNEVFFNEAAGKENAQKILFARSKEMGWLGFEVYFSKNEQDVVLDFKPIDSNQMVERMPRTDRLSSLSALVINTQFIPEHFDSWMTALTERAVSAGVIQKPEDLKIILISEKENRLEEDWLKCSNVVSFILKPVDQKSMAVVLAEAIQVKYTPYVFSNLGWIEPRLRTHLSKPVELAQLSEFGATINTSTPFKEGSFFFLRKGIFDEAPNGCLAARVYKTEPHPSEEGRYLVYVTYFGITDYFLKHARSYMREQYASAKTPSS